MKMPEAGRRSGCGKAIPARRFASGKPPLWMLWALPAVWIAWNAIPLVPSRLSFDPPPFPILSFLAAITALTIAAGAVRRRRNEPDAAASEQQRSLVIQEIDEIGRRAAQTGRAEEPDDGPG